MSAVPFTLSDVLSGAISLLTALSPAQFDYPHVDSSGLVGIYVGEKYLRQEGATPRVIFVRGDAETNGGIAVGARQVGGISESVDVYVWGSETLADLDRYRDAEARFHQVYNALKASAPGRLKGRQRKRLRGTNIVTDGEEFVWTVEYTYAIPQDEQIWAAAQARAQNPAPSPPNPDKPDGDTGLTFGIGTVELENTRP